ncbi:NAD(P)H-dependent oxidoreductase [uncultured Thiodictyon sp.]|uniref:NAD(P)H-dependent oxidoreductase n=1 Tax=uncultured Thiodictyon sp. TaxID=1846217 RepID=UPI0025DB4728|nr:NAD(P)H-dependent oxidoreductase [uncultured Thiodictyon sp.]
MNCFIVYWHPEPQSFNGALLAATRETLTQAGHPIRVSDLHAMGFNPVSGRHNFTSVKNPDFFKQQLEELYASEDNGFAPEIESELKNLEWCDLLILQFPLWWFGMPAVLKGWVDRVFAMGRTYGGGHFYENGVFQGKRAMLSLTTGGPQGAYEPGGFNGDLTGILRPLNRGILRFVGFDVLAPQVCYGPAHLTTPERTQALADHAQRLRGLHLEDPIDVGIY